jgi:F-type H+-transporting ATPase subunit b
MSLLSVTAFNAVSDSTIALAEGGVTVDLDLSLFVQAAIFMVLLFILKPTLFDPMMRLFEEREKRIEGTRHAASREDERSAKALAKYEGALASARKDGTAERDALRADGAAREQAIMAKVRTDVAATLDHGRAAIAAEEKAARAELRNQARALGRQAASRVLGREIAS